MELDILIAGLSVLLACTAAGAWFGLRLSRRTAALHQVNHSSADAVLKSAERRRRIIVEEATRAARGQFESEKRRIEDETAIALALQEDADAELNEKQSELDKLQNEKNIREHLLEKRRIEAEKLFQICQKIQTQSEEVDTQFVQQLVVKLGTQKSDWEMGIREEVLSAEKLGISRWLLDQQEALKEESKRYARAVLSNVYTRYNPTFVWPKVPFTVEVENRNLARKAFAEGGLLPSLITEGTESTVELVLSEDEKAPALVKIGGGAGVDKEVIRLSLEEILGRNTQNPDKIRAVIAKHRKNTERFILKIGEEAVRVLGLPAMHPEILKLIGALNYRTSHRQNQYFHSLEVARLAGMLADEVGVDPILAKRSGLLHDIGKVLDWKIEGSHAVISGDYATRYGEEEVVVDTVLAHHDDKIIETPHAFILKAADAMSGARPGARVDMEEGYQNRIQSIVEVVNSFQGRGVLSSAVMHAGREVHVFVDNRRVKKEKMDSLAEDICKKLQDDVQFPGQIRVTLVRRLEVSEVA
jgi:ribonucrease Y